MTMTSTAHRSVLVLILITFVAGCDESVTARDLPSADLTSGSTDGSASASDLGLGEPPQSDASQGDLAQADLGQEPVCGDGVCNGSETCSSCAGDCGACPPPKCGNSTDDFPCAKTKRISGSTKIASTPTYRKTIKDPHYGGYVTLITGKPGTPIPGLPGQNWPSNTRHQYSSHQAFSADSKLIYLARGRLIIDVTTYAVLKVPALPDGFLNWHTSKPDLMIAPRSTGVGLWNVRKGTWADTVTIPGYHGFSAQTRTSPSYDGKRVGVKAWRDSDNAPVCIAVDLQKKTHGTVISFDDWNFHLGGNTEGKARRCTVSPSGKYLILNGRANNSYNDQAHVFDWDTGALVLKQQANKGRECPGGHGDFGLDSAGNDVFVGICKGGGLSWSSPHTGKVVALKLSDGKITNLGPGASSHTSCRNSKRPGWCYSSSYGSSGIIDAKKIDGSKRVEYYLNPQNHRVNYYDETQAVPSPDGRKVLFVSRWNDAYGGFRMFVLDLADL